jgi:hypothetical protein
MSECTGGNTGTRERQYGMVFMVTSVSLCSCRQKELLNKLVVENKELGKFL